MKKILNFFLALFIAVLLVIVVSAGALLYKNSQNVVTQKDVREFLTTEDIINHPMSGFSQLNEEEKATYLRITNELTNLNSDFYLTGNNVSEDAFNKIFTFILKDHPEYFYVNNYQYYKNNNDIVERVIVNFTGDQETILAQQAEVENWKNAVLGQLTPEMSNYDIAKTLHDYIITNVEYDPNSANNQNILSVIENNRSVCAGYSKAYQYLLNNAGIFATYVSGDADIGSHAWNLVEIDGEYGWVDLTWDDPSFVGNDQPEDFLSHEYFGLSSADIAATRNIDQTYERFQEIPVPSFNYFIKEGLYFDLDTPAGYSQFKEKLLQARLANQKNLEVRVASLEQVDTLLSELSADPILFQGTINYITDEKLPIITFLLE